MKQESLIKLREIKAKLRAIASRTGVGGLDEICEELFDLELSETIEVILEQQSDVTTH